VAAGSRSVNPIERREIVYDRIRLDPTIYEPVNERLPKQSLEKVASRCFTIEAGLEEDGVIIIGYPDLESRNIEVPMLVKISDGMSQGEFLHYWRIIGEEARSNWDEFQLMIDRYIQQIESLDAAAGVEHEETD
jgi:hypothetical protein